uniref:Late nodulin n=1 Tax=Meloidogyne incognita TaxID=6306 RepID=A0A914MGJ9_MELIC
MLPPENGVNLRKKEKLTILYRSRLRKKEEKNGGPITGKYQYLLILFFLLTIFVVTVNSDCCSDFNCKSFCKLWCRADYYCLKLKSGCSKNGCCR